MSFDSENARLVCRIRTAAFLEIREDRSIFYHKEMGGFWVEKEPAVCQG